MIKLEMKNCNMILTEKQQKYQFYRQENLINMNPNRQRILPSDQSRIIEQAKFTYCPVVYIFTSR